MMMAPLMMNFSIFILKFFLVSPEQPSAIFSFQIEMFNVCDDEDLKNLIFLFFSWKNKQINKQPDL